ncbi:hypothetical protein FH966_09740 [Lentibacillus cibarius]|uniref:Uncharacterized protein n=1 Tax=Lentibacillus cibarius TaxID=2583219 RepID=A0A549YJ91_9BACI|nr:hypothetical protein [Lentibacillus cibarius]TMN23142.1 hypothetical protein FFL34_14380 [Lentibacillus cibarius]TRM11945.1 hypothetical protein FH966_09740 [Lentibacillus cibarius]
MGYLLPVNHYQYRDYQRRVTKDKHNPFYIDKPNKTIPVAKYQNTDKGRKRDVPLILTTPTDIEAIYTEITGKGRHINQLV